MHSLVTPKLLVKIQHTMLLEGHQQEGLSKGAWSRSRCLPAEREFSLPLVLRSVKRLEPIWMVTDTAASIQVKRRVLSLQTFGHLTKNKKSQAQKR